MKLLTRLILFSLTSLLFVPMAAAQVSPEFQMAERLMRQQQFEQAASILENLVKRNPAEYVYFNRLIETDIQLKKYDEALQKVQNRIARTSQPMQEKILEAKIYHIKGDTAKAFELWQQNLSANSSQFQAYQSTGNALKEARAYDRAIQVYLAARKIFNNEQLFLNEVADTQMQAGNYEGAIGEWIGLLRINPQQRIGLQRLLMRYNDPLIYDITIMEVEEEMSSVSINSDLYKELFQLQSWLFQETKLYKRALNNAITYEKSAAGVNFIVFNLGKRLLDAKEFELAAEAYQFYLNDEDGEAKWRSMEELAGVYAEWAKQKDDLHLDKEPVPDELYRKASALLLDLEENAPNYSRLGNIILQQAEIAMDFTYNFEAAGKAKTALEQIDKFKDSAELYYLEGRLDLVKKDFVRARIAFTKSNKKAGIGALAEKTRYFLALTDFFSGDLEYANIQLKSLGRQNTSYYANDALELRLWIQKNKDIDSTATFAQSFADAVFEDISGNKKQALDSFGSIAQATDSPYMEDALIAMAGNKDADYFALTELLNTAIIKYPYLAQRERLMWERARAADIAAHRSSNAAEAANIRAITLEEAVDFYETLITEYPQSFYAPFARERLPEIIEPNS